MLGCDMPSQETYLSMLNSAPNTNDQKTITDFIVKKVASDEQDDHTFKVFSNPYGAVSEVP